MMRPLHFTEEHINWLEKSISKESFHYYEYSEFKNILKIGKSSLGTVYRANWEDTNHLFIMKSEDPVEIANEVLLLSFS